MRGRKAFVVHVAALQDHEALQTVCRTTQVLAARRLSQVVVSLDSCRRCDMTPAVSIAADRYAVRSLWHRLWLRARRVSYRIRRLTARSYVMARRVMCAPTNAIFWKSFNPCSETQPSENALEKRLVAKPNNASRCGILRSAVLRAYGMCADTTGQ